MKDLRVAVIGARPRTIGWWQAREFLKTGAEIVAVFGSTEESAEHAVHTLKETYDQEYKINPNSFPISELEHKLQEIQPDAVSVCSPTEAHYHHTLTALKAGAHVLCEKPLHWDLGLSPEENLRQAEELFSLASKRGLLLTINTQLAALFDNYIEAYQELRPANAYDTSPTSFIVQMVTAGKGAGIYIPMDILPHALSLLLRIDYHGTIEQDKIEGLVEEKKSFLHFNFNASGRVIETSILLEKTSDPLQRELSFGFEDLYVTRGENKKDPKSTDTSYYLSDGKLIRINVEDPLAVSIRRFCDSARYLRGTGHVATTLIPDDEAIANIRLQTALMNYLTSIYKPS